MVPLIYCSHFALSNHHYLLHRSLLVSTSLGVVYRSLSQLNLRLTLPLAVASTTTFLKTQPNPSYIIHTITHYQHIFIDGSGGPNVTCLTFDFVLHSFGSFLVLLFMLYLSCLPFTFYLSCFPFHALPLMLSISCFIFHVPPFLQPITFA